MKVTGFWIRGGTVVRLLRALSAPSVPNHGLDIDNRDTTKIVVVSGKSEWQRKQQ